ncbi:asparagine synthase-related protein [Prolixibacteraceae bacterium]|nr:asparagine synthase-related protein [Prolixibacteraceae bacterium]
MCGVLFISGKDAHDMCEKLIINLKHRGPDNTKIIHNSLFSIGFTRLSINDQSSIANQPFDSQHYISATNGEIYNYRSLIKKYNLKVESDSDTHIIPQLFNKIGANIIDELDGFYASLLWDKQTGTLYAFRDYIGKKNLFLVKKENHVIITNELKICGEISYFKILPKGISKIDIKNFNYTTIKQHKDVLLNTNNKSLTSILTEAVIKRIPQKNEKFGVFLSGGLDSSIIYTILKNYTSNIIYYVLGEKNSNDYLMVKTLVKDNTKIQIRFIPLPTKHQIEKLITKIVYTTESYNPSIISNGICTHLLSKEARNDGIKVVISGEGADELFNGYFNFKNSNNTWTRTRKDLIENMYLTELRRIDLCSMHNSIEIRCPFLDKKLFSFSNKLSFGDLHSIKEGQMYNKYILRKAFEHLLPKVICYRKKTSFDVGSGIRRIVIEHLTNKDKNERSALKKIWVNLFDFNPNDNYFHQYPILDKYIDKRSIIHSK